METTHHLRSWAGTNTSLVPVCSRDHVFFLDPETETQPHRNQLWDSRTKQKGCHGPVSESRRRSERPTPQSLTRRQKMTRGLGTRQPTQHQQNHRWHNAVPLLCLPACLPMQTLDAALCIYPPLSPRFFSPSIMVRPTDVTTKTAQLHGLDRAICLTSRPDIHCSRPSSGPLPHGYQHLPTSPRDETQLSIVRTDRSTAPRPSDMPSPPRRPRSTT